MQIKITPIYKEEKKSCWLWDKIKKWWPWLIVLPTAGLIALPIVMYFGLWFIYYLLTRANIGG